MTHNERVLQLLADRKPHTHHEIYGLHVVGHSRVSDLRKQGHEIAQWRVGDDYLYQLIDLGTEPALTGSTFVATSASAAPESVPNTVVLPDERTAGNIGLSGGPAVQLSLLEVVAA